MTQHDYEELFRLERARTHSLLERGERTSLELEKVREERNMLARRAAEMAHELVALKCPK
jgi:hypothetical protein